MNSAHRAHEETAKGTLVAGGDLILGRWVSSFVSQHGPTRPLRDVARLFRDASIGFANLECVVSTRGQPFDKNERRPIHYRAPPAMLNVLCETGIDVVSLGNNHAMDYGPDALAECMDLLKARNVAWCGAGVSDVGARGPAYVSDGAVTVAFIGYETWFPTTIATPNRPGINHLASPETVLESVGAAIREARCSADLVVVTPHWSKNWVPKPTKEHRDVAHSLLDAGADAILGHASHLIHGVEIYKGRPIVYDLGILLADRLDNDQPLRWSMVATLEYSKRGFHALRLDPIFLSRNRAELATGEDAKRVRRRVGLQSTELAGGHVQFERAGEGMRLSLDPSTDHPYVHERERKPEVEVFRSRAPRPLPEHIASRRANVVLKEPPAWTHRWLPAEFDVGLWVLGADIPNAVRHGFAFMATIALRVSGPIEGNWCGIVEGRRRGGPDRFEWVHPIADGVVVPAEWRAGDIILDETCVRCGRKVAPGVFDLYWGFYELDEKQRSKVITRVPGSLAAFAPIGSIEIRTTGVPEGPAGIKWGRRFSST